MDTTDYETSKGDEEEEKKRRNRVRPVVVGKRPGLDRKTQDTASLLIVYFSAQPPSDLTSVSIAFSLARHRITTAQAQRAIQAQWIF